MTPRCEFCNKPIPEMEYHGDARKYCSPKCRRENNTLNSLLRKKSGMVAKELLKGKFDKA
jgi:phage FluMu protein Com